MVCVLTNHYSFVLVCEDTDQGVGNNVWFVVNRLTFLQCFSVVCVLTNHYNFVLVCEHTDQGVGLAGDSDDSKLASQILVMNNLL